MKIHFEAFASQRGIMAAKQGYSNKVIKKLVVNFASVGLDL